MEICADLFGKGKPNTIFILTHAHMDHGYIPQKFKYPVYCSQTTGAIMIAAYPYLHAIIKPILHINKWCNIQTEELFIFDSHHCMGSIGFFHNGLLHWGDGRPNRAILDFIQFCLGNQEISTIKHDTFFEKTLNHTSLDMNIPSIDDTTNLLLSLMTMKIKEKPVWIVMTNYGTLDALPTNMFYYKYKCAKPKHDNKNLPDKMCHRALEFITQKNEKIPVKISLSMPNNMDKYFVIKLSAIWFFTEKMTRHLSQPVYISNSFVRVFLCRHASPTENKLLFDSAIKKI